MIKVLFFAKLREALDCEQCSVALESASVAELRAKLIEQGGERWERELTAKNILCAVNQRLARDDQQVTRGDEVAFYPPVTGG